jgi:hypothetical protein
MERRAFVAGGVLLGASAGAVRGLAGPLFGLPVEAAQAAEAPSATPQATPGPRKPGASVDAYRYPRQCPQATSFTVRADGQEVFAYRTSAGVFAAFACSGPVEVEIEAPAPVGSVRVAPSRHGIAATAAGNRVRFVLPRPLKLLVEIEGQEQLFLYADPIEHEVPDPGAKGVHFFRAGQVHEVGELLLRDGETAYLEGGAVVRGCIRATSARGVRIAGRGVLDGGYYRPGVDPRRSLLLEDCRDSRVEDVVMVEPSSWMIVLGACQDVSVRNVKELGAVGSTDGVDIVGSKRIRVQDCFCRNGDDCIAVKSLDLRGHGKSATIDYSGDVEDVEISGCAFLAYIGGQALEIGHELRTASVRDVRFRDCDILGVHGYGGAFGIHNADRAVVSDVLYERIRVEHHYNKLLEFRISRTRWSKDAERGQIRNVTLRDVDVAISQYNPGYSCSMIGGCDPRHTVEHVRFERFRLDGKPATSADELDLYLRNASDVTFA